MDPFIGQIMMFGGNFPPRGWAFCDGQLVSISSNQALFSILGTTYGGDGRTNFALPDLRSRLPLHPGSSAGPGLTQRRWGQKGGTEQVTLTRDQMPAHNHSVACNDGRGNNNQPAGHFPATEDSGSQYSDTSDNTMAAGMVGATGAGQAHDNMPPYLCVNFCIALIGVFPSRN